MSKCELCGEPMPPGEEMFKYHGYSGDCPKPPLATKDPVLRRTGNIFSIASTEYEVTYPDGHVGTLWSPPWHELDDQEEDAAALTAARQLFLEGKHK